MLVSPIRPSALEGKGHSLFQSLFPGPASLSAQKGLGRALLTCTARANLLKEQRLVFSVRWGMLHSTQRSAVRSICVLSPWLDSQLLPRGLCPSCLCMPYAPSRHPACPQIQRNSDKHDQNLLIHSQSLTDYLLATRGKMSLCTRGNGQPSP